MRRKKWLTVMMTVIMCCTVLFPAGSIQAASTKQEVQSTLTISKEQEAQSTLTVSKEQEVQSTPSAFQSKDAKNIDVTTAKDGVVQQKKQSTKKTKKTKKAQTSSKKTSGSKKTTEILDTDVSEASKGCTLYGAYGTFYSQAQKALDQINQYRKEACSERKTP